MKLSTSFLTALTALRANTKRSILTILGIVIGISAVILIISLSQGAQSIILNQVQGLGAKIIFIEPGKEPEGPSEFTEILSDSLKMADFEALQNKANAPFIERMTPMVIGPTRVFYAGHEKRVTVLGTTPMYQYMQDFYPAQGRFISEAESRAGGAVAVLGDTIKNDLFGASEAVGKTIKIKNKNLKVVGVMARKGASVGGLNYDEQVIVPLPTAQKEILGIKHLHVIMAEATETKYIETTVQDIKNIIRARHNITDPDNDDFHVFSQADIAQRLALITGVLTILLGSVAAVSLIVGGIGIMNIMLVSVAERTREIGLRKAVGATNKDILKQFLLEAILLTASGGIIGLILGAALAVITTLAMNYLGYSWDLIIPVYSLFLSFGVSTLIGLVFGIFPARRASKLNPIAALRYE